MGHRRLLDRLCVTYQTFHPMRRIAEQGFQARGRLFTFYLVFMLVIFRFWFSFDFPAFASFSPIPCVTCYCVCEYDCNIRSSRACHLFSVPPIWLSTRIPAAWETCVVATLQFWSRFICACLSIRSWTFSFLSIRRRGVKAGSPLNESQDWFPSTYRLYSTGLSCWHWLYFDQREILPFFFSLLFTHFFGDFFRTAPPDSARSC